MLHEKLINPKSIVIVGGSDNITSPGGRVLKNLIDHHFKGELFVVNPNKEKVQGIISYKNIIDIPSIDLAIIAIAANQVIDTIKILTEQKNTKGFIIFSAGFSELNKQGVQLEHKIVSLINKVGGSLLGPNNIGLINKNYTGVFTTPIPKLNKKGVDLISGSGATAVFIMEAAQSMGLPFSNIYTVGNSAQIGIEEILEHFDETYSEESSKVKLLYIESINNPHKFLKHSISLKQKGCSIAAIKAGSSVAGNKAASSHTGAMATPDVFVDALFKKAGIIRCYGRNELVTIAGILIQKPPKGKNIAIVTHAGGPAVMLTDVISKNGLQIPPLSGKKSDDLLSKLYSGSSVTNPIDFLATGTAEQLETIIDYCENKFYTIDAMAVIFGSPGLSSVYDAYNVLDRKIKTCKKPIYAILPSVVNVKDEINDFIAKGNIAFNDEVLFGKALANVYSKNKPKKIVDVSENIDIKNIQRTLKGQQNGYLTPKTTKEILEYTGINVVHQFEITSIAELNTVSSQLKFPVVLKVVGPIHKSDVGGVLLDIKSIEELQSSFIKLMTIKGTISVIIQPMLKGIELFIGAKREANFNPIVMCGMGGIFVETLKDLSTSMAPISKDEALQMVRELKTYPILKGIRGKKGIHIEKFTENIRKISALVESFPEIVELDINPFIVTENEIIAIDARIKLKIIQ